MKKLSFLIGLGMLLSLFACKKENKPSLETTTTTNTSNSSNSTQFNYTTGTTSNITPGSVVAGIWNVVTDTTFAGVGLTNHLVNYSGQPGDYFDFRADGHVYTKEGAALDTFSYHLLADTGIYIGPAAVVNFRYLTFNAHTLVAATGLFPSPGGMFGRKVSLNR